MIVESIALEGVRHFRNRVEIAGFQPGLNLIVAPNGTGKSTVIDGLVAALVQSHKTSGDKISAWLRHVAYDLTPTIEVTLQRKDGRYRVRKAFLKGAYAKLEFDDGNGFATIADDDDVEAWLDAALALDRPGAGVAKQEQYGLGALLWSRQAEPKLGKLPSAQEQHLRSLIAPGSAAVSSAETRISEAIIARFEHFWEPKGKKYAKGQQSANVPALEQTVAQTGERHEHAAKDAEHVRHLRTDFDEFSRRLEIRKAKRDDQRRRLGELKDAVGRVRELEPNIALAEQRLATATRELDRVAKAREALIDAQARIKSLEPELHQRSEKLKQIDVQITAVDEATDRALLDQSHARGEAETVAAEEIRVVDARNFRLTNGLLQDLEHRLESLRELRTRDEEVLGKAAGVIAPDDKEWEKILKARDVHRTARQRVKSESLSFRFTPDHDVTLHVRSGSPQGERVCKAGVDVLVTGLGVIEVEIPKIGTLRLSSPMASATKLLEAQQTADEALSAMLAPYGGVSIESLAMRREERAGYERDRADIESRVSALLEGAEPDAFIATVENHRAQRRELLGRYPDWAAAAPDPDALSGQLAPRREAATSALAAAVTGSESQHSLRKALVADRGRLEREHQDKLVDIATYRSVVKQADAKNLSQQSQDAAREEIRAKAQLETLSEQRAAIPGDPIGEHDGIQASIERLSADIETDGKEIAALGATLETKAGAHDALAVTAAELEAAQRRLATAQRAANAAKMLREHVEKASRAIGEAVNGPLAAQATTFARRIMSRDDVRIGFEVDDRGVMRLSLGMSAWNGKTIADTISGGELEQIELATRLAMGSLLAKDESQVVILDDALAFCDPVRLYRILDVLAEMEPEGLQVILTGCDADRYASMPKGANRIDLDALLRRAGAA